MGDSITGIPHAINTDFPFKPYALLPLPLQTAAFAACAHCIVEIVEECRGASWSIDGAQDFRLRHLAQHHQAVSARLLPTHIYNL
jgi:hypothetical protein